MNRERWNHHEDTVWSLLSHKYAKSMKCIDKIIYIYEKNNESITRNAGTLLELQNILNRHEAFELIFDKDTEIYFYNSFKIFIYMIKRDNYFVETLKTNKELRFRVYKIFSDFINRYESKNYSLKFIFSFLKEIS